MEKGYSDHAEISLRRVSDEGSRRPPMDGDTSRMTKNIDPTSPLDNQGGLPVSVFGRGRRMGFRELIQSAWSFGPEEPRRTQVSGVT
jgi:hypothetical protein